MNRMKWRKGEKREKLDFKPGYKYMCHTDWKMNFCDVAHKGEYIEIHKYYPNVDEFSFYTPRAKSAFIRTREEMMNYVGMQPYAP